MKTIDFKSLIIGALLAFVGILTVSSTETYPDKVGKYQIVPLDINIVAILDSETGAWAKFATNYVESTEIGKSYYTAEEVQKILNTK